MTPRASRPGMAGRICVAKLAGVPRRPTKPDRTNNAVVVPSQWGSLRIVGVPFGKHEVGVLLDSSQRTASATLLVRTEAFSLLSGADQERRSAAWGALLASLARESQAVRRIAWYERTLEAETDEIAAYFAERRDQSQALEAPAVFAYAQLVEHGASAAIEHECLLSVEISTHARRAEIKQRAQTAGSIEQRPARWSSTSCASSRSHSRRPASAMSQRCRRTCWHPRSATAPIRKRARCSRAERPSPAKTGACPLRRDLWRLRRSGRGYAARARGTRCSGSRVGRCATSTGSFSRRC